MEQEKNCAERINEHLISRIESLNELWAGNCEGNEEKIEEFNCFGLSLDYIVPDTFEGQEQGYFEYLLSTGGPADMFRFYVNPDFSCYRIEYRFHDWFDGAGLDLTGEHKALMKEIWEYFRECGTPEYLFNKAMKDYE